MKELMIHVERIVRPIRATQSRKLRMRRELLEHLEDALTQERERCPDDPAAIAQALRRLGPPAQLSAELQQSVPLLERTLLGRVGAERIHRWEPRAARFLFGVDRRIGAAHAAIIITAATFLPYAAGILVALRVAPADYLQAAIERPGATLLFNLLCLVLLLAFMMVCGRLMAAIAEPTPPRPPRLLGYAAIVVILLAVMMLACIVGLAARPVTPADLAAVTTLAAALLLTMTLLGRLVRTLRRPYDPWLTLEIAD